MSDSAPAPQRSPAWYQLTQEVQEFLYMEADLLDTRQFDAWLELLDEDLVYHMPMRLNVKYGEHEEAENTKIGRDISWFEEDKWTLTKRVEQIQTGVHWAEEPLSRVCHMVTNVRLLSAEPSPEAPTEVKVSSRFLVYQNRVDSETYFFVGRRTDVLKRHGTDWKIIRRELILDQSILQAKNLSVFF